MGPATKGKYPEYAKSCYVDMQIFWDSDSLERKEESMRGMVGLKSNA